MAVRPAIYIGPIRELYGKRALIRDCYDTRVKVWAQFDDTKLKIEHGLHGTRYLGHEWHPFDTHEFEDEK